MRERTVPYVFTVEHIKGVRNIAVDCLSRYPNFGTKLDVEEEVCRRIVMEAHEELREDPALDNTLMKGKEDQKYLQAIESVRKGLSKEEIKMLPSERGA